MLSTQENTSQLDSKRSIEPIGNLNVFSHMVIHSNINLQELVI